MMYSTKRRITTSVIRFFRLSKILLKLYPLSIDVAYRNVTRDRIDYIRGQFRIVHFPERELIRLGDPNDGGYILIDELQKTDICLSLGIGDNSSFDREIAKRITSVHMFDHTVDAPTHLLPNQHFHKFGISSSKHGNFVTLLEAMSFETEATDYILKIDIEGSEWDVFSNLDDFSLSRFRQITAELHNFHQIDDDEIFEKMKRALEKINSKFDLFNIHINNWGDFRIIKGVPFPDVVEVSYVRKDSRFSGSSSVLLSDLNAPNNPIGFESELSFLNA